MAKDTWHISKLRNWDKNPRTISTEDFLILKQKINRWGQFKPVVITPDGEVLGGNMRLRAYQELGIEDIWVSIIEPKNDAEKLEIAITDNENSGRYDDDKLAELVDSLKDEICLQDYKIDLGAPIDLQELLDRYSPSDDEEKENGESDNPYEKVSYLLTKEQAKKLDEALGRIKADEVLEPIGEQDTNDAALAKLAERYLEN